MSTVGRLSVGSRELILPPIGTSMEVAMRTRLNLIQIRIKDLLNLDYRNKTKL
jgi:hypothetical protein